MTKLQRRLCAALLLAAMACGTTALAQEDPAHWMSGRMLLGDRIVDYDEDVYDFDDYDANRTELAFGYRF